MPGLNLKEVDFPNGFDPVRIGDLDFAREFTAYFSEGYELDIELIDGAPTCVAIRNQAGIASTRGLREDLSNLSELVREATTLAQQEPGDTQLRPLRRSDLARARKMVRSKRRRRYDNDYHQAVLEVEAHAKASGEATDIAVMEAFGLDKADTARTQIRRAKDALGRR